MVCRAGWAAVPLAVVMWVTCCHADGAQAPQDMAGQFVERWMTEHALCDALEQAVRPPLWSTHGGFFPIPIQASTVVSIIMGVPALSPSPHLPVQQYIT